MTEMQDMILRGAMAVAGFGFLWCLGVSLAGLTEHPKWAPPVLASMLMLVLWWLAIGWIWP